MFSSKVTRLGKKICIFTGYMATRMGKGNDRKGHFGIQEQEQRAHKAQKCQKSKSRKSVRWSAVPVPCLSKLCLKFEGKQDSGPKGVDDLCFHIYGEFFPPFFFLLFFPPFFFPPKPSLEV